VSTAAEGVRHGDRATSKRPIHSRARCISRSRYKGLPPWLAATRHYPPSQSQGSGDKAAATAGPSIVLPIIYRT